MRALLIALLVPALLSAQKEQTATFQVSSRLVIVNVGVRDKSGKAVDNLKAEDFTLLEDGKAQKIGVFEFQRISGSAPQPALVTPAGTPAVARVTAITPSKEGQIRYKDRRLLVLFFDLSSMQPAEQIRAQKSALEFLDHNLTEADLVSIMVFSTKLKVLQDFTSDRETLREIVRKNLQIGSGADDPGTTVSDDTGDDNSFQADETEFNIFNTDRKLTALEDAARMLASLPEKKALVYFSSGISKTGTENQSQLRATVNAAVRANISFYPVDARGLVASAPAGDATQGARSGRGLFSGGTQRGVRASFEDQQETLSSLAADTGGKAFMDSNDLALGIAKAQEDIGSYYILGYYTSNPTEDGRFRRVQVKLNPAVQAKLDYRSGYFAPKQFNKFNSSDKEKQLEDALLLGDPITDLPLAVEVNYFRLAKGTYFVPIAVKIPGSELDLVKRRGADSAELDFIGQVRDLKGKLAGVVRDNIRITLKGEAAGQIVRRAILYDSGFTLAPGDYKLKFLARENTTGKIGTFETGFHIPDVNAEDKTLRTSSVVWSNQREALTDAVGAAEKNKKLMAANPLVRDDRKLLPSITRTFRKDQNLYVYLEVYDSVANPANQMPGVSASLSFYRGNAKAFQTDAIHVTQALAKRSHALPLEFQVPLENLPPGNYTCQVNVIDEYGRKFAFPRARVALLADPPAAR
jgi:VWFA-related protein